MSAYNRLTYPECRSVVTEKAISKKKRRPLEQVVKMGFDHKKCSFLHGTESNIRMAYPFLGTNANTVKASGLGGINPTFGIFINNTLLWF